MTIKLACAPIAWTNDDLPELGKDNTFEQCISEMSLAGYQGTEVGNKYPRDPNILHKYLDIRNLEVASAWFSAYLTTKPYEETEKAFIEHRDFLHAMGAKVIVVAEQGHSVQGMEDVPVFDGKPYFTDEEWKKLAEGLNKLGDLALEKGMKIVYHHHMGTGVQTSEEVDKLMELTDPNKVFLLYDTGHLVFSGEDPIEFYKKYSDRIKHIHFKDVRQDKAREAKENKWSFLKAVKEGTFTVPSDGCIDFEPILDLIYERGYDGWIVVEAEQDPAIANPYLYHKKAKSYIDLLLLNKQLKYK